MMQMDLPTWSNEAASFALSHVLCKIHLIVDKTDWSENKFWKEKVYLGHRLSKNLNERLSIEARGGKSSRNDAYDTATEFVESSEVSVSTGIIYNWNSNHDAMDDPCLGVIGRSNRGRRWRWRQRTNCHDSSKLDNSFRSMKRTFFSIGMGLRFVFLSSPHMTLAMPYLFLLILSDTPLPPKNHHRTSSDIVDVSLLLILLCSHDLYESKPHVNFEKHWESTI